MPRPISTVLVLALLAATASAFAVTETLKVQRTPIVAPRVDDALSPVCECESRRARIEFRLRRADTLTLSIVDAQGDVVRTIAERRFGAGRVRVAWDGRLDNGSVAPEGRYRPRVRLAAERRTIVVPNEMRLDVTPPDLVVDELSPTVFSPDGDGRSDRVRARYRASEPAQVLVLVNGKIRVETFGTPRRGKVEWYGRLRRRPLRPGLYALSLMARDPAGNLSEPTPTAVVRIRFVELRPNVVRVRTRARFGVRVSTDARSYRWIFARRRGRAAAEHLVLRAPAEPGRYELYVVTPTRHADRMTVIVAPRS